jgi:hypothetical protein
MSQNSSAVTDYELDYQGSSSAKDNSFCRGKGSYSMKLLTHLYPVLRLELYFHVSCTLSYHVVKRYSRLLPFACLVVVTYHFHTSNWKREILLISPTYNQMLPNSYFWKIQGSTNKYSSACL